MPLHKTINVEPASRQVIEHKLLTALEDEGCCAAIFSKEDLNMVINGLHLLGIPAAIELRDALRKLKQEAFK